MIGETEIVIPFAGRKKGCMIEKGDLSRKPMDTFVEISVENLGQAAAKATTKTMRPFNSNATHGGQEEKRQSPHQQKQTTKGGKEDTTKENFQDKETKCSCPRKTLGCLNNVSNVCLATFHNFIYTFY